MPSARQEKTLRRSHTRFTADGDVFETPSIPQPLKAPLRRVMLVLALGIEIPFMLPETPCIAKPFRSSVTLLVVISIPFLPLTPVRFVIR